LIKGAEQMLHENVLMKSRIQQLEEQLAEVTKRKTRKRKRIQHGGTLEYGAAALLVAESAAAERTVAKRARGSSSQEGA
jgi:cell division septum initiation protein DivIVA